MQAQKMTLGQALGKFIEKSNISDDLIEIINDVFPGNTIKSIGQRTIEGGENIFSGLGKFLVEGWENDKRFLQKMREWMGENLSDEAIIKKIKSKF